MNTLLPTTLQPGDTIGLIAPSSPPQPGRIEAGVRYLKTLGFNVKIGQHVHATERFLAGSDAQRAADLMAFVGDSSIQAIVAIAGGYGSQRLLPLLDFDAIKRHPKLITGFSDTTALQLGLFKMAGLISYTGFTFRDVDQPEVDPLLHETFVKTLSGEAITLSEGVVIKPGHVQAPLIGGNLECLAALMGTPYQPDYRNCLLFIEDVFAEPFQTDQRLTQLALAGIFEQVSGVIFGIFAHCIAKAHPERDGTIEAVITEWSHKLNVPVITDFPYGHITRRCMLPIGKVVELEASHTTGARLRCSVEETRLH